MPRAVGYQYRYVMIPDVNHELRSVRYIDVDLNTQREAGDDTPVVLFIGTGQTVDSFAQHVQPIANLRRLIVVELRGQGQTQLDVQHCTMSQYIVDIKLIFDKLHIGFVHLCGYSFGGRVSLAFASIYPDLVKKLSITAVPLVRPALGKLILESCCDSLRSGHVRACAWSLVLNGYSESYLDKRSSMMESIVNALVASNDAQSMYNLISMSNNVNDNDDFFSVTQCCLRLNQHHHSMSTDNSNSLLPTNRPSRLQVIAGTVDRLAGWDAVRAVAARVDGSVFVSLEGCGHLCVFEAPLRWRNELMQYFISGID